MHRLHPSSNEASRPAPRDGTDAERLRVGGLVPLTTIDYPGELAAVVFCQGCPWRCGYCHNPDLIDPSAPPAIPWASIRDFLERRRGLLDAVVFSGGEPTLQTSLPAAMREARALGFKVGLHTAGPYPERLAALLPLVDWVGLDIKALPEGYQAITGRPGSGEAAWRSLGLLQASGVAHEVRTTIVPGWTADEVARLSEVLAGCGVRQYALQTCSTGHTLNPQLQPSTHGLDALAAKIDIGRFSTLILR